MKFSINTLDRYSKCMKALLGSVYRFLKSMPRKVEKRSVNKLVKKSYFAYQKHAFPRLEVHVTNKCNLACQFCSHCCDIGYADSFIDIDAALVYMRKWSLRLLPTHLILLGGEPLLEKRMPDFIVAAAYAFPHADRALITNGILLDTWSKELPYLLKRTCTRMSISMHPMNSVSTERFEENCRLALSWKQQYGIDIKISDFIDNSRWRKFYQHEGRNILPFTDKSPYQSRRICFTGKCTALYKGSLYQCPPLAYLPDIAHKLHNKQAWEPYLSYKPLDFSATDFELSSFFHGLHAIEFCAMCPSRKVYADPGAL